MQLIIDRSVRIAVTGSGVDRWKIPAADLASVPATSKLYNPAC
jgi:hypothetical protein